MALAGIELKYLTKRISEDTQEYYVSNIYGIDRNSILFKLHHPEKPDILLVLSTMGMWITTARIQQIEENRLIRRLRKDIIRLRLTKIDQPGLERLAYLTFEGFDKRLVLVGEFFGDGNIILCNDAMKVLALQHSIDVRHRSIKVGTQYELPPQVATDILSMKPDSIQDIQNTDMACARWIGRNMGLPRRYTEGILNMTGTEPKRPGRTLDESEAQAIYDTSRRLVDDIIHGNHTPVILPGHEVIPVSMGAQGETPVKDFMSGLDEVFTSTILERGRDLNTTQTKDESRNLQNQLAEQEKAISTVQDRHKSITQVANSMYAILAAGAIRLDAPQAIPILEQNGAAIEMEKGIPTMHVMDQRIPIDLEAPLQSTASLLYSEAKRQSAAVPAIEKMIQKTRKKLQNVSDKQESQARNIEATQIRKKNWFERYRWFYTSDGILAIGGRDAPSNSAVVRKHMEETDIVFHAQIFGSPFFILKGAKPSPASILETAQATVCFSRAWREGMFGSSAFWVTPQQVKKSAPSGQFLPKGSFTIEGQRNFIKTSSMRLALGFMQQGGHDILVCGPVEAVSGSGSSYIVVEPTGSDTVITAKKIRSEFMDMDVPGAKEHTIDDYVRVLPAGKSHVVGVHHK